MVKPEKIYLQNTNYNYALSAENPEIGNLRETFFFNQLQQNYKVTHNEQTDFCIDGKYYFEVGGKNKSNRQIKNLGHTRTCHNPNSTVYRQPLPGSYSGGFKFIPTLDLRHGDAIFFGYHRQ